MKWTKFACSNYELCLDKVLRNGQSFRWKIIPNSSPTIYRSVLNGNLIEICRENQNFVKFRVLASIHEIDYEQPPKKKKRGKKVITPENEQNILKESKFEEMVKDYLNLKPEHDLTKLYKSWMENDEIFDGIMKSDKGKEYYGIRILRQNPVECLFSFVCSANNNIKRISGMVEKLCEHFGAKGFYEDEPFYSFPDVESLAAPEVEQKLRKLGFGYRAKYIMQTAQQLMKIDDTKSCPENYLLGLREIPYSEAKKTLMNFSGVGPKVADCVCLMCLDKTESVPVDTHVRQITAKYYMPKLNKVTNISTKVYQEIGDKYLELFGNHAGWAHSVLFSMDLKLFE